MTLAAEDDPHRISNEDALRNHYHQMHPLAGEKCRPHLDKHSIEFIERSPFLCIGTTNEDGRADVSPRGDPPGSFKVLDHQTIAIPDRPGNNRLDTMTNILSNSHVGLLFMIPGFDDTMRINGQAQLTKDPALLKDMVVQGREPKLAIVVKVEEVFIHCAKAFRRSKLWDSSSHQDRSEMPSIAQIILDQTSSLPDTPEEMAKIDQDIEDEYRATMY